MSDSTRGCRASADVMTPDAILRTVSCGKFRTKHGRWHENRDVRWRGRYVYAENIGEASERLIEAAFAYRRGGRDIDTPSTRQRKPDRPAQETDPG